MKETMVGITARRTEGWTGGVAIQGWTTMMDAQEVDGIMGEAEDRRGMAQATAWHGVEVGSAATGASHSKAGSSSGLAWMQHAAWVARDVQMALSARWPWVHEEADGGWLASTRGGCERGRWVGSNGWRYGVMARVVGTGAAQGEVLVASHGAGVGGSLEVGSGRGGLVEVGGRGSLRIEEEEGGGGRRCGLGS